MKDIFKMKKCINTHAEGIVTMEYRDPKTKKVVEKIRGHNHVFTDSLFGLTDFRSVLSRVPLFLSDDDSVIDEDLPFLTGNMLGYGVPNEGGSGLYKGSWNAALGYLAQQTSYGFASKFVYDFTPSQAIGQINKIGLTEQYKYGGYGGFIAHKNCGSTYIYNAYTDKNMFAYDGYLYGVAYGIVTKTGLLLGIPTTIDLTSIVGTAAYHSIGVNPTNGRCYILVGSYTAGDRKLYEFTDTTFSSLLATYLIPSYAYVNTATFGIYGDMLYGFEGNRKYNIATDTYTTDFIWNTSNVVETDYYSALSIVDARSIAFIGKYMIGSSSSGFNACPIVNLETGEVTAKYQVLDDDISYRLSKHLVGTEDKAWYTYQLNSTAYSFIKNATAIFKVPVDAPARPDGYGMTITYEVQATIG